MGVVDTDIQSPGIHVIFGLNEGRIAHSLNEYLWGKCRIEETTHDVTENLGAPVSGKVFLIPSSIKVGEITRILREGFDPKMLNEGFQALLKQMRLDALLIDTHPGVNEETLLAMAISDVVFVILRPDQQDYLGTGVTVELARRLNVGNLQLIVNKAPKAFDPAEIKARVEDTYNCPVAAVIPHSDEMMALASAGLFSLRFPEHSLSRQYRQMAQSLR